MGNVGDNGVSGCRLRASATQQLSYMYVPTADVTPICVKLLGSSRQPMTRRLATHPSNTAVRIQIYTIPAGYSILNDVLRASSNENYYTIRTTKDRYAYTAWAFHYRPISLFGKKIPIFTLLVRVAKRLQNLKSMI